MRQYFRCSYDLIDDMFLKIEVDSDILTVKAYQLVFPEGLPENLEDLNIIDKVNYDNPIFNDGSLLRHNVTIEDKDIQNIIKGEVFESEFHSEMYFKFFGGAQILRGNAVDGTKVILIRTTEYDRQFGKNIGYDKENFREWTDCSLWSFDYNFSAMNWYYPRNTLFDSYLNKSPYFRNEFYNSVITYPRLIKVKDESSIYSSGETRKRLFNMFIFDKDDSFLENSFYVNVNQNVGAIIDFDGNVLDPSITWKLAIPVLKSYNELPIPKIQIHAPKEMNINEMSKIKVSLYDNEFYIKNEDNNSYMNSDDSDSFFVLEEDTIDDLYNYSEEDINPMNNEFEEKFSIRDKYIIKKDIDVYITTNKGYLNTNKISLKNGIGYFKFRALDLDDGDEVKLKLGFKTFSNVSNATIKIVDF